MSKKTKKNFKLKRSTSIISLIVVVLATLIVEFYDYSENSTTSSTNQKTITQTNDDGKLTVVFYNVENLFDPADAPTSTDDEFTPKGEKKWTYARFNKKIKHIAEILKLIGKDEYPDVIAFAEVENKKVLEKLIEKTDLKKANYKIIHVESSDPRGIDVALIYKPSEFKFTNFKEIYIYDKKGRKMRTRPILQVEGYFHNEKVYIFVNHWKSRVPSQKETEWKRVKAAATLYNAVRKILNKEPNANIIIVGDFNDTCHDKSLYKTLKAKLTKKISKKELYNALAEACKKDEIGTVYHNGWSIFDYIIVSKALLDTAGLYLDGGSAHIFTGDDVLKNNRPNRTYVGSKYLGGVSDHLPVYAIIKY